MKTRTRDLLVVLLLAAPATTWGQVRQTEPIKIKSPKPALSSFHGEVLNFTPVAITVRDPKNTTLVRTFEFTPELQRKLENRYLENGDRVTVRFVKGGDTAVKLKGKIRRQGPPSLPSRR